MNALELLLSLLSGSLIGLSLGLVGGGGSILAVPLLVYLVGVADPHVAIGTSALAVAANALVGLGGYARAGHVKWRCALVFAATGVIGAWLGARVGREMDGQVLLGLFALLMLAVAGLMLRSRGREGDASVVLNSANAPRLVAAGGATGLLSGFFGIGGGFLVVPGLVASTGMPLLLAVGSSLVVVSALGLTTAISYAREGLVDWTLAAVVIAGGAAGSAVGLRIARRLSTRKGALNLVMAALIALVAVYMLARSATALGLF